MFSTPLTASSIGVATERATTSALAPGYEAVTCTVGGAISGNCVIGRSMSDMIPSNNKRMEITVERTGLLINVLSMIVVLSAPGLSRGYSEIRCFNQGFSLSYSDAVFIRLSTDTNFGFITMPSFSRSKPW